MKFENKSNQFKRAVQALAYALSIADVIEDAAERDIFDGILGDIDFDPSCDGLLGAIDEKFSDYDDYEQINQSHFTGVWFQQMKKESGEVFAREVVGNEFTTPKPVATFVDTMGDKLGKEYDATQNYCFFVPFNTPNSKFDTLPEPDETGHVSFSIEQIKQGGEYNSIAKNALDFGREIVAFLRDTNDKR